MMLGEPPPPPDTAVNVTPWPILEDPDFDPSVDLWDADRRQHLQDIMVALQCYFPHGPPEAESNQDVSDECSCDEFRMYEFKVRRCARGMSHDWTECPYAHPGEKARRRDPRRFPYSGTACPDFRKGCCRKGDCCEFAHGVFECWLHPSRYRTQPCKDGMGCRRRVCFFAHSPEQLRVVSQQSPRSGITEAGTCKKALPFTASPGSLSPEESPPMSPSSEVALLFRNLQLNKVKSLPASCLSGFGSGSAYGSPRGPLVQTGFLSLPTTPTGAPTRKRVGWEIECSHEYEEPVMERVESGRSLRARMLEKLSRENSVVGAANFEADDPLGCSLDVGWVSDLLK